MNIKNIRTFLPGIDFNQSKQFYQELGFQVMWENQELCMFGTDVYNFFLQDYYNEEWANNLMMQLFVDDVDTLYNKALNVIKKFDGTKIKPIFETDYGRTFHLIGPSGELWHMTEVIKEVKEHNKLICEDE